MILVKKIKLQLCIFNNLSCKVLVASTTHTEVLSHHLVHHTRKQRLIKCVHFSLENNGVSLNGNEIFNHAHAMLISFSIFFISASYCPSMLFQQINSMDGFAC